MKNELIALYDMDGTLFDYKTQLVKDLENLSFIGEPKIELNFHTSLRYLQNRIDLITSQEFWWANLPKFKLGWDVLSITKEFGFQHNILT